MGCCSSKHPSTEAAHSPDSTSVGKPQENAAVVLDEKQGLPLVADSLAPPVPVKPPASSSPKQPSPAYGPVSLPSAETLKEKSEKHNAEYTVPLNSPKKEASSSCKDSQNFPPSPLLVKKSARNSEVEDCSLLKLPSSAKREWLSQAVASTVSTKVASSRNSSSSRDPSPVDLSRVRVRPSSPLKKSPSVKELQDGPHLTRSSSGKASSPSRTGTHGSAKMQADKAAEDGMRGRSLHRRSLSKESLADPAGHRRSGSRDSTADVSSSDVRKPSPPKKVPTHVSCPDTSMLNKRPANKEDALCESRSSAKNSGLRKIPYLESSSVSLALRGRSPVVRTSNSLTIESDYSTTNGGRTVRRKDKSPLRRTSNGLTTPQGMSKIIDRNADLSINSENVPLCQSDFAPTKAKDVVRQRKVVDRLPLREISDNSSFLANITTTNLGFRECTVASTKPRDGVPLKEPLENALAVGKVYPKTKHEQEENTAMNFADEFDKHREDSVEVKVENLVLEGKSVLGAFKALEEFRIKQDSMNLEVGKGAQGEMTYSHQFASDSLIQSLPAGVEKSPCERENTQQAQELQRSRSTKRSCEPFLFPDVQSLLMPESQGMQFDGDLTMPASISKACSILRAVADLNMGTSIYSKKKDSQDEIEQPNLLSFQFGERDPQK